MGLAGFYKSLLVDKGIIEGVGFNPYYRGISSGVGRRVMIEGQEFVNLASNNYLGLTLDQRVKEAVIKSVDRYGASMCGTPIATGNADILEGLGKRISAFIGLESTLLFPSCYQANCGLFSHIAGTEDLVLVDHYAHASLVYGIKGAGCKFRPFLHNNPSHLEKILSRSSGYRHLFVVTESVFSTEGSIAPFGEIVDICKRYEAVPVIDDSHGIGVLGERGRGILEEQSIENYEGIYTASMGKALANAGGIVSGKKGFIDYLQYSLPSLIYSTALPPGIIAGIDKVIGIIEEEFPSFKKRLWGYKERIKEGLIANGFKVIEGKAPVNSILSGDTEDTILLAKKLYDQGILSVPFVPPSVPPHQGRVRLIAGADLQEEDIMQSLEAFRNIV